MLSVPPHVHWAHVEGGTAVLDLHTGRWHLVTGAGARIWEAVTQHGAVQDVKGLSEELAVLTSHAPAAAQEAVDAYVGHLRTMGLLTASENRHGRTRRWWRR
ncbi:PqqD family protein [Streptomyces klenkii]|uniref:PqqD family protein n=1 Tax=Streptomyces klenkii TaxID=1420899 RepID=UPI003424F670